MKISIVLGSFGVLGVVLYGLVNGLSEGARATILGGLLVMMGVALMGVFVVFFLLVTKPYKEEKPQREPQQLPGFGGHPMIVLTGGSMQQGLPEYSQPAPRYQPRQLAAPQPVDHEDW